MAHKMKGFPMMDTSSMHGTNKNYDKSGPPNLLGKILDPLGLKKKLMGGNKNCPPPPQQAAQVVGAAQPVAPVTPTAPAAPVVDPNAGVSAQGAPPVPMKENLKVGAPMKTGMTNTETGETYDFKTGKSTKTNKQRKQ